MVNTTKYCYITSLTEANKYINEILGNNFSFCGIDTETTGLNVFKDRIRTIQIAIPNAPVYIFDNKDIGLDIVPLLRQVLNNTSIKIFHNAKFDLKFLANMGIFIEDNIFDTMLAEYVIMSGSSYSGFKLSDIANKYTNSILNKDFQTSNWSRALTAEQLEYAANDASVLLDIYSKQLEVLKSLNLMDTMELENKVVVPTYKMELAGFKIDKRAVRDLKVDIIEDRAEVHNELKTLLPNVENYNSPSQVKNALLELGLKIKSTEKDELTKYKEQYPAIDKLLSYKKISKRISLLDSLVKEVNPETGRIYANYKQCMTTTGRYSCTNPNLQGIPNSNDFRRCFACDEGNLLVIADYSQIELRIIAEVANDETMIDVFNRGEDIHKLTASIVNHKAIDEVTSKERQSAKAMNFGLIYGMGYKMFRQYAKNNYGVDLSEQETKSSVDNFFLTYRGIGNRLSVLSSLFSCEERTLGNRRRLWNYKPIITERANAAIQGTGADILKQALINVNEQLLSDEVKLISTVHDEIILECHKDKANYVSKTLKDLMEQAGRKYLKSVPIIADVSISDSWAGK